MRIGETGVAQPRVLVRHRMLTHRSVETYVAGMSSSRVADLGRSLVLVTGGGSGIGRATAHAFADLGAEVVVVDVDVDAAAKVAADCGGASYVADVSDAAAMDALGTTVHDSHGPVDVLVNNAGVGMSGRFLDMSDADWDWILGINLRGVVNGCRAFVPPMLERGSGQVVNVSSGLAYTPRATEPAYVATKAAVLALSRCQRADWRDKGVGVSAICPGVIDTAILESSRFLGQRGDADVVANINKVFGRGHKPESVAGAIVEAVRHDRGVVPVGFEARLGWALHGVLPGAAVDWMARFSFLGI